MHCELIKASVLFNLIDFINLDTLVTWDLDVEACELFDRIFSEQIWKIHFEEIDWAKEWSNLNLKKLQDQMMKL